MMWRLRRGENVVVVDFEAPNYRDHHCLTTVAKLSQYRYGMVIAGEVFLGSPFYNWNIAPELYTLHESEPYL